MSLETILSGILSVRDRLRTALVAKGAEADSNITLHQIADLVENLQGGGSAAYDLVKVTGHTTTHSAYSAVTQIVVSGLTEDQEMGVDFSGFNGTYTPTSDTAAETDPLKRIYKHATANKWIKHYVWDPEETGEGTGYWLLVTSLSYGLWDADLSKTSSDLPLSTGTATWSNENYGMSSSVTLAVTTVDYPAETWSLTVQKVTGSTVSNYVRTYTTDNTDISLSSSDIPIKVGGMAVVDNANTKLVLHVSNNNKQGAGMLLDAPLTSAVAEIGADMIQWYGNDSEVVYGQTEGGITGVRMGSGSLESILAETPDACTIAIWSKINDYPAIIMSIGREVWGKAFNFYIAGSNSVQLTACGDVICSASNVTGAWHHFAATHDNGTCKLYVDGVLASTGSYAVNIGEPIVYINGSRNSAGGSISGLASQYKYFARAKVYNVALSAQEIAALAAELTPSA